MNIYFFGIIISIIVFMGIGVVAGRKVKNIDDYYAASHCVVLPSHHEGMSNVMLEGQANGRPVISTDAPGCRETFIDGVSGYMCRAKDADSLFDAMEKMIKLSDAERREMGLCGRKYVENNYDRKIVIDAYVEEIKKVMEEKKNELV